MFIGGKNRNKQLKEMESQQGTELGSQGGSVDSTIKSGISDTSIINLKSYYKSCNPWRLLWGEIGEFEGPQEIFNRLQNVWDTVLALGGLIAGFSYIVLSSNVDFPRNGFFGREYRPFLYGFFSVLTFVFSLGSALLTVILQNTLKMSGPDTARWFAVNFENLVGMPEALVGTSIGCMLFAGLIAIDGLFPQEIFWFAVISGFTTFMALGAVWWKVSNGLKSKASEIMLKKKGISIE